MVNLSRRGVLAGLSGLVLAFNLPGCASVIPASDATIGLGPALNAQPVELTAWVRIAPDNIVTLRMGAAEMGQGVFTSLPMILAEELDVAWEQVRAETAPAHSEYRRESTATPGKVQLTGGSESTCGYWDVLRQAGAAARAMLVAEAAERWGVSAADCRTEKGYVKHGEQSISYGELAEGAATRKLPKDVPLKDKANFSIIGTSPRRLDMAPKVDGSAKFGIDVRQPGQLFAAVKANPQFGGLVESMDATAARAMPGVKEVLQLEHAVVVVAKTTWHARQALAAVNVTWAKGPDPELDDATVRQRLQAALDAGGTTIWKQGKVGETDIEAVYEVPYLDHAPIEPLNATAWVRPERVDIWAPTQAQGLTRRGAAKLLKRDAEEVFVHTTFLGGGFGRKSFADFTNLAVEVASHFDVPVQVIWSREECFAHGFYRPAVLCRQRAKLGADGMPVSWKIEFACQSAGDGALPPALQDLKPLIAELVCQGFAELPYDVPNVEVTWSRPDLQVPVGWWRSVQASHNGFFRESFVDEMAKAAGKDPIEYRLALLKNNPRQTKVLKAAVEKAGALPAGLSRGAAIFNSFGSICAEVADVSVEGGKLKVHHVGAAMDCGQVVHPDTVVAQVEGAIGMGLSAAMREAVSLTEGRVQTSNFHEYRLLTLAEMPQIDVALVPGETMGGVGEPGLPPIAGAVCNALASATGERVRKLPIGGALAG